MIYDVFVSKVKQPLPGSGLLPTQEQSDAWAHSVTAHNKGEAIGAAKMSLRAGFEAVQVFRGRGVGRLVAHYYK